MATPRFSSSRGAARSSIPRRPYRFSQTATPDQLLPVSAQEALMRVWGMGVRYWQRRLDQTPTWHWGRDSEPLEPEHQAGRCSSTILHAMSIAALLYLLDLELERGLRLLLASRAWYWGEDARRALTGVLGRIGQIYVELERRRRGKSSALTTLLSELAKLPGGLAEAGDPLFLTGFLEAQRKRHAPDHATPAGGPPAVQVAALPGAPARRLAPGGAGSDK